MTTLRPVEEQFNAFCSAIDTLRTDIITDGLADCVEGKALVSTLTQVSKAAMFAFEKPTCDRIAELVLGKAGEPTQITAAPMPFDTVLLVDAMSTVALLNVVDHDPEVSAGVLRTADVITTCEIGNPDGIAGKSRITFLGSVAFNDPSVPVKDFTLTQMKSNAELKRGYRLMLTCDTRAVFEVTNCARRCVIVPKDTIPLKVGEHPRLDDKHAMVQALQRDFISAAVTAIEQLWYINLPRHHVIEKVPKHLIKQAEKYNRRAAIKTPRFGDRPQYILVEPEKVITIRPAAIDRGGSHASPVPHMRAGYTKVLRAARFKHKQWAVINVRPTWVGPEEWDGENCRFRVVSPGAKL